MKTFLCSGCGNVTFSSASPGMGWEHRCEACGGQIHEMPLASRIGDILVAMGYVRKDDVLHALLLQNQGRVERLGEILLNLRVLQQSQLQKALSIQKEVL
ncbi:MAG TPA: hypothetical protein P5560_06465 [Thermotogota bacterium]|nr:hypothetical protein [Thermotogota bacterium]HRW92572.1 hypothetical protein [Thermotogota bacterium]